MKIPAAWHESKFVDDPITGVLRGSRNVCELSPGSRLVGDRVAAFYTRAIRDYAHGQLLDLGCGKAPFLVLLRSPYVGATLAALLQSIGAWFLTLRVGRYATLRSAERFPLGYSVVAVKK